MSSVLLVEDDPILGEGLVLSLQLEGHNVDWAKTLSSGKEKWSSKQFDLVLLDMGLPDGEGIDLCREIRKKDQKLAVIFLTAKNDEQTVVECLNDGANDFIKKPFSHRELMARIKAALRLNTSSPKLIKVGELAINIDKREVTYKENNLGLNRRQFDLLAYFMKRQGEIITRDQLIDHLGQENEIYDRTIDSHLS
jgi:two-component system OmpR family response regulator